MGLSTPTGRRQPGRPLLWRFGLRVAVTLLAAGCLTACGADGVGDQLVPGPSIENDANGSITGGIDSGPADAGCSCPLGYACVDVGSGLECLPDATVACASCAGDHECLGGRCRALDGDGSFCAVPCKIGPDQTDSCPTGFSCTPLTKDGATELVCMPDNGSCTCRPTNLGQQRPCKAATCSGTQTCKEQGWTLCDAPGATEEICDGKDNDCDGAIDDGLPETKACTNNAPGGSCAGNAICQGKQGWVCDAKVATPETCNGVDDDCDGTTDEPWLLGGKYIAHEHCGTCNNGCATAFAHATSACDPTGLPPHCVVVKCDDGYELGDDGTCVPQSKPTCKGDCSCTADKKGDKRDCTRTNDHGTCWGKQLCQGSLGWAKCDATVAAAEICNGLDEDCDGKTDEGTTGAACTNSNPFGVCKGKLQCAGAGGPWCDAKKPAGETCNGADDDCDGKIDETWIKGGHYLDVAHCGKCDNACPKPLDPNSLAACDLKNGKPTCGLKCKPGFHDANGIHADGCECQFKNKVDTPGGGDANCDGVDGMVDQSIFVAKVGTDTNPGTRDKPVLTLNKALAVAKQKKKAWVLVGAGAYLENVKLIDGVSLSGGYGKGFAVRDPEAYASSIVGIAPGSGDAVTVRCEGVASPTFLLGMRAHGAHAKAIGASSYAMYVRNCAGLRVGGSMFIGGNGGEGVSGSAGDNGVNGSAGKVGLKAKDIGKAWCGADDHMVGGLGGQTTCKGVHVHGGQGGTSACPDYNNKVSPPKCPFTQPYNQVPKAIEWGRKGLGQAGGGGGEPGGDGYTDVNNGIASQCKFAKYGCDDCVVAKKSFDGKKGWPGAKGGSGKRGAGCGSGVGHVVNGAWRAFVGQSGGLGAPGSGGGGGGAAGGIETVGCKWEPSKYTDLGGSGGGGGAGGCGGSGGKGGGGGGASFAVFIDASSGALPAIGGLGLVPNVMVTGDGGPGGGGGVGGFGGLGGKGGPGGPGGFTVELTKCAMPGGAGGVGGPGGHGGGGGGGCGGPSVGIGIGGGVAALDKVYAGQNKIVTAGKGGPGGAGGKSGGLNGTGGSNGAVKAVIQWK